LKEDVWGEGEKKTCIWSFAQGQ